jgi:hypothetical protein
MSHQWNERRSSNTNILNKIFTNVAKLKCLGMTETLWIRLWTEIIFICKVIQSYYLKIMSSVSAILSAVMTWWTWPDHRVSFNSSTTSNLCTHIQINSRHCIRLSFWDKYSLVCHLQQPKTKQSMKCNFGTLTSCIFVLTNLGQPKHMCTSCLRSTWTRKTAHGL